LGAFSYSYGLADGQTRLNWTQTEVIERQESTEAKGFDEEIPLARH
jgi:hypothetical protein